MHISACLREPAASPLNPPISGEISSHGCSSSERSRRRQKDFSAAMKNDWNESWTGVGEHRVMRVLVEESYVYLEYTVSREDRKGGRENSPESEEGIPV